jgi:hypothetical protein
MSKDPSKKNKRSETQKAADLALIEHWHIQGKTERELVVMIAVQRPYRLSQSQVHADLMKLKKVWMAEAIVSRTEAVASELKGLKAQEDELWAAWHKSKLDATTKTAEKAGDDSDSKSKRGTKTKVTVEGQTGEAAYMRLILDIRQTRRELLGLDLPKELKLLGDAENPLVMVQAPFNPEDVTGPAPKKLLTGGHGAETGVDKSEAKLHPRP